MKKIVPGRYRSEYLGREFSVDRIRCGPRPQWQFRVGDAAASLPFPSKIRAEDAARDQISREADR